MTKKQTDLFEAAKKLFYRFGVKKVTVTEICEEAGASKMTFYKYFPNKTELAKRVIDDFYAGVLEQYETMMQSDLPVEEKFRKTFELKIENALNIEMDFVFNLFDHSDETLQEHLQEWDRRRIKATEDWFMRMQQNGLIMKEISFSIFMSYAREMQNFAMNEETMRFFGTTENLARMISRIFLYGIAEREENENPNIMTP